MPIGEVPAEKNVTEQKKEKKTNKETLNLVSLPKSVWKDNNTNKAMVYRILRPGILPLAR